MELSRDMLEAEFKTQLDFANFTNSKLTSPIRKEFLQYALSLINDLTRRLESYALQYGTVADKEVWLKQERVDTVRKMQERIRERLPQLLMDSSYLDVLNEEKWFSAADQLFEGISQIADEIIGETK